MLAAKLMPNNMISYLSWKAGFILLLLFKKMGFEVKMLNGFWLRIVVKLFIKCKYFFYSYSSYRTTQSKVLSFLPLLPQG